MLLVTFLLVMLLAGWSVLWGRGGVTSAVTNGVTSCVTSCVKCVRCVTAANMSSHVT